jgi:TP901 family phage tail tape measure protein
MPPVVLEIVVNADKGIAELRQLDKALSETTKATQQQTQAQNQATQSSTSFASSLAQSAKSAAGLALGFAGVAGIATTLSAAATAATGFEAALNAISALGTVSTQQLSQLREQLLALPPALGSSTELAKGLYDILGANVPADNAITVLTRSAELAKGGLGNLDTAINAVTKSAAAFGIPLEQAQYVTDVFAQTVVRGQGRLEEFAQAFPQVAATAAATGASFIDTNAAIAVLTQTFKNADTAATGLNSFFQQLIQNSAKFAAEGINVKQVLAEEGLTGIFRRLNEVTGGSAERLKELINDSEGFRAALTLTGTQFETFNETVGSYANVTGLAQQAASKNLAGAGAAWQTFINTLDRLVQEVAPPLLSVFTSITGAAATLAADVTKLWRAFAQSETLKTLTADLTAFFRILGDTAAVRDFAAAMGELNASMLTATGSAGETYNALDVLDQLLKGNVRPAIDFVTAGWDLLNAAFDYTTAGVIKLGQYLVDGLVTPLAQVVTALDQAASALGLSDGRFSQLAATSKQLSAGLELASATFQQMADDFVLGTNRLGTAQEGTRKTVSATSEAVKTQSAVLPQQGKAASAAAQQTEQLSDAQKALNKAFDDANNAASGLKATLEKLKLGDVIKAISTEELERSVKTVITQLKTMEESGKFSARQISQAYEDAADVLRARFGALPAAFQQAFDAMRTRASTTADGIQAAFERLGLATRAELQRTATEALADFTTILDAGTATPEQLLDTWLDVVEQIDKAGFQQLPTDFQAVNTRMLDIARKAGVELPKPYVDAFGDIALAGKQAAEQIDTSWLQSRGALERAKGTVEELAASVVKLSDETQRLMDLQISVETTFASDVPGLLKQLQQARQELQGIQSNVITAAGGAPGERDYRIARQLETIAALQAALAKLGVDELGRPLPGTRTATGTTGTGTTATGTGTTGTRPTGGGSGVAPTGPLAPTGPPSGSLVIGGGTAARPGGIPDTTTQRTNVYQLTINTQAQDAASLARDLVPYLRQADLSRRPLTG